MSNLVRPATTASISVHVVRTILLGAASYGLDPIALVARFGIEPETLSDVDARVPAELTVRMWDEIPVLCSEPNFGLLLGETAGLMALTLAGHMIQASATLGDGLRRMLEFYRVFNDVHPVELLETRDMARLRVRTRGTPLEAPRHAMEFAFAWFISLARRATGVEIEPRVVRFEHGAPNDITEHQRLFGCHIEFGADACEAEVFRDVLDLPHTTTDVHLVEVLESHARELLRRLPGRTDFASRVRSVLYETLKRGESSVDVVARELKMSPRTVQRYLQEEGTSHQAVADDLRRDLALRYLEDRSLAIAEIAFVLGFSDQSAFHKAFVRWTGKTPGQHRRATS